MDEYIDREAISEEIRKYYYKNPPNFSYGEGFDRGLDRAQRAILDAPAADVAPVVHGRWGTGRFNRETGNYEEQCTHCRNFSKEYDKPYCPNCGAEMDGGDDNEAD